MPKIHIYDHITRTHTPYTARVVSTDTIATDHDGGTAGETARRVKKTHNIEYEITHPTEHSKWMPINGALLKDDLANWQSKTYLELEAAPEAPAVPPVPPAPPVPVDPPAPPAPIETGPPKPKK